MSILDLFRKKPEPLVIHDELGTFIMKDPVNDRSYSGEISWLGENVYVDLYCSSDGSHTADIALGNLRRLVENADDWDKKVREYIADDMSDEDGTVEIWGDDEDDEDDVSQITREEFLSRISAGFINIYPNGDIFFDYNLDEMFTDHGMGVSADISGEISSCGLWG